MARKPRRKEGDVRCYKISVPDGAGRSAQVNCLSNIRVRDVFGALLSCYIPRLITANNRN